MYNSIYTSTWSFTAALANILPVFVLRALPFLGYGLLSPRVGRTARLSCAFTTMLMFVPRVLDPQARTMCVRASMLLLVFAVAAAGVFIAVRLYAVERTAALRWVLLGASGCLFVPVSVVVDAKLRPLVLVLGWELLLSAVSYVEEYRRTPSAARLGDCVFFLLVNPTVVYPESGSKNASGPNLTGALARGGFALCAWLAQDAICLNLVQYARATVVTPFVVGAGHGYFQSLAINASSFSASYLGHSGLASLRICYMNLAGYTVPECYRCPLLAKSPREFWQRWNVWVTSWARRYLFLPMHIGLRRRITMRFMPFALVAAVLATFVGIGLLHDLPALLTGLAEQTDHLPRLRGTILFAALGIFLLVWEGTTVFATKLVTWSRTHGVSVRIPPLAVRFAGALAVGHGHYIVYLLSMDAIALLYGHLG